MFRHDIWNEYWAWFCEDSHSLLGAQRAFLTAYNSASDEERLRMVEGLGKCAGLALLVVPMADAFIFSQA